MRCLLGWLTDHPLHFADWQVLHPTPLMSSLNALLMQWHSTRAQINAAGDGEYKISVNDFVMKASALALRDVPELNASWMGTFIRQYDNVDINVAVQTESGLLTPLIPNVDKLGLQGISSNIKELAGKARDKKLTPADLAVRPPILFEPQRTISSVPHLLMPTVGAGGELYHLKPWHVRNQELLRYHQPAAGGHPSGWNN
jgi:hypothetical protein